ncbi:hypothetical protein HETIRDRAFT_327764 [Heterobasidion irregulare TC 32-1]|uniref:Uncharacterized protein n=1 Tax=Heterobasidion irregulare (strain TC 32-1) TaxID=747525 RepID=W4JX07_HETIT|nr:uncharacterized protein HETIRDRAFT_327764 [Heterobasidion irregulare TC 32-1]ETW77406.1 hypothetical protein HETIRDRAFT_327764 [Heterobasidion irregulare TC 32-1]
MDVSMIRKMRRQGDIPYRLIPKNPLEFNDDPCFPMDRKQVIPLCNVIESYYDMMGYASGRFRTTVYFGCETVSGIWPRSMRSHRHAEIPHQRNKVITCRKFNSSDGTFSPSFEATVVNRYMNRALLGVDIPYYRAHSSTPRGPEDVQRLIGEMCLVKELVEDPSDPEGDHFLWEWTPAIIESDWAGPFLVRFEKGYRAHLKHGDELVHAIWAAPNTAQARDILRAHDEPMAEPVVE